MPAESLGLQTESVRLAEELHGLAGDFKYSAQFIDLGNDSSNTYPISTGRRFASVKRHHALSKQKCGKSKETPEKSKEIVCQK